MLAALCLPTALKINFKDQNAALYIKIVYSNSGEDFGKTFSLRSKTISWRKKIKTKLW